MSTSDSAGQMAHAAVSHYLDRLRHLLLLLSERPDAERLLAIRLAPDMFDTGLQLAIAVRFAARTLCPPAGQEAPEIPDLRTCGTLLAFQDQVARLIATLPASEPGVFVTHQAGEARLDQPAPDYMLRFAFPNMLFHLSMAYAGLRHGGMAIGKADFDGLHAYG